jgi:HK97 family phage portal protein
MGFFQNLFNFRTNLTESDRSTILRWFGSFKANQFEMQGNGMIENSYEKNVDVYSVIKKIVDITKSVPWIVEQKQASGNWKELKNTTVHELMQNPNVTKGYTWNDIEEMILIYLLVTGNVYIVGEKPLGMNGIAELEILPSNHVLIQTNDSFFNPIKKYEFSLGTTRRVFESEEIGHIKFFNPGYNSVLESSYGLSLIQVARQVIQVGNDRWDANANLLQNRGAVGLITDKSQRPMTTDEAKIVQSAWQQTTGGTSNFGKIKVTNKDLNYIQMSMSPSDLQLVENGVVNLRAICNVFGLDSSLFNDPANKTYNNALEAQKALYTNAIMPISDKIAEHFTRFICANHFPDKTVRMRQDFSKVECLQENIKEKTDLVISLRNAGIISANEAREKLGDNASSDENADKLIINTTLVQNLGTNNVQPVN